MSWRLQRLAASGLGPLAAPMLRPAARRAPALGLVLAYHRIGVPGDSPLDHALWNASAEQFEAQVRWLQRHADLVPLSELPGLLERGRGRYVALTFDDGYLDNHRVAFPILRAAGASATFFISTGFVDQPRTPWWDEIAWIIRSTARHTLGVPGTKQSVPTTVDKPAAIRSILSAVKRLPGGDFESCVVALAQEAETGRIPESLRPAWLTWQDLLEMETGGMEIGGHTVNHPVLARLDPAQQRDELQASHDRLQAELGAKPRAMSYPVGSLGAFDLVTQSLAEATGWTMACHYAGGALIGPIRERFAVPRMAVEPYTRLADLAAALAWPGHFA